VELRSGSVWLILAIAVATVGCGGDDESDSGTGGQSGSGATSGGGGPSGGDTSGGAASSGTGGGGAAGGIAQGYPGDEGIEGHPDVIFADDFETYENASELWDRWDNTFQEAQTRIATESGNVYAGNQALEFTMPQGDTELSNAVQKVLTTELDALYLRWYSKFEANNDIVASSHNGGGMSAQYFNGNQATPGIPADGTNKFLVEFEHWRGEAATQSPGLMNLYVYHPLQRDASRPWPSAGARAIRRGEVRARSGAARCTRSGAVGRLSALALPAEWDHLPDPPTEEARSGGHDHLVSLLEPVEHTGLEQLEAQRLPGVARSPVHHRDVVALVSPAAADVLFDQLHLVGFEFVWIQRAIGAQDCAGSQRHGSNTLPVISVACSVVATREPTRPQQQSGRAKRPAPVARSQPDLEDLALDGVLCGDRLLAGPGRGGRAQAEGDVARIESASEGVAHFAVGAVAGLLAHLDAACARAVGSAQRRDRHARKYVRITAALARAVRRVVALQARHHT
jgi:hypothetical protein